MKNLKITVVLILALAVGFTSCNNNEDEDKPDNNLTTITDNGSGTGTTTWETGDTIILDGLVFVNDGDILTIEPGVVIKGMPGAGENASALVVARGAQINAIGTADEPIVFTALADDLNGSVALTDRGLWGGLIILGSARLNSSPGETAIEGIPTSEPRGIYGGSNDDDNSGTLRYVSIRHGGTDIGEGNEINGLTLGGVGNGTVIEFIEVVANKDDGVEFFGGQPRLKNILVAYCGDDSFDYDEGFRGYGQFWCAVQDTEDGDRCGEHDGGTDPETAQPYAIPTIFNATYIGRDASAGKRIITFRDNAGGFYANSIFVNQAKGIDFELLASNDFNRVQDSYQQIIDGNLSVKNSIFWNVADGTLNGIFKLSAPKDSTYMDGNTEVEAYSTAMAAYLAANEADFYASNNFDTWNNEIKDPGVSASNPVATDASGEMATTPDTWFENVNYKGAFGAANWAQGWTLTFK
ncbi:MAG: hypothetical protein U9R19_01405 [Bacteroidota bacterium]|nr:hypothetical protein [Bacteroidota bacterium]